MIGQEAAALLLGSGRYSSEYRMRAVRLLCPFSSSAEEVFHLWQPEP